MPRRRPTARFLTPAGWAGAATLLILAGVLVAGLLAR